MHFLVDSFFKNQKHSTLAPSKFSLTIFLRIKSTIWRPKSVSIKRAAKTIMLHCGNVENCEDTSASMVERGEVWWREEKSRGKDERIAWPGPQMMLATRLIHIYRIFLYTTFQRVQPYDHNGREVIEIEEILLFNVVGLMIRTGVTADFGPPTPPCPNLPANMDPPPSNFPFRRRLYHICYLILFWGGVSIRGGSFFPPTSGSRDLRNCFASHISHAKHHLFPDSSEKIPVSDGNDRQLLR